jgi:hypothetical protein
MRYKIGYKQRGQWRYFIIESNLQALLYTVEKLFSMGYTQVSIKLFKSEV